MFASSVKRSALLAVLLLPVLPPAAAAHHSAVAFDLNAPLVSVTGKVTRFVWRSPHTSINMEVVDDQGQVVAWKFEGGGTTSLVKHGFTRSTIKPGDVITVTANPLKDRGPGGLIRGVELADGRRVDFGGASVE